MFKNDKCDKKDVKKYFFRFDKTHKTKIFPANCPIQKIIYHPKLVYEKKI